MTVYYSVGVSYQVFEPEVEAFEYVDPALKARLAIGSLAIG